MTKDQASKRFYRVDSNYDFTAFMDRGQTAAYENRWVFETAWEVCNKGLLKYICNNIPIHNNYVKYQYI